jgi:hypothetical protein
MRRLALILTAGVIALAGAGPAAAYGAVHRCGSINQAEGQVFVQHIETNLPARVGRLGRYEPGCALVKQLASTDYSDWNERNKLDSYVRAYIGPQGSHGLYMGRWKMSYEEAEGWVDTWGKETPAGREVLDVHPSEVEEVVGQYGHYWVAFTFAMP